ncbi:MAG TPA: LLM class F420-dependent oxidoreductase, partial [Ilumatobacteraceae bacterium]
MEIGAVVPHHEIGTDPGAIKAYAQGVEELGATHLLIYDHVMGADRNRPGGFTGNYDKDTAFHEPFTFFSFVAAVTQRIDMVTAVMILPQRQTVLVAKQAAELAILSGDRFRLGVGTGWNKVEYQALNEEFSNRGRRQTEQVELLRRLWSEDAFSFDGEFHTIELASINPRPTQSIPILFGGSAPALLERCARLGDGWLPLGTPNDSSRERIDAIRSQREAFGRPMDGFLIQAQAQYAGGDPDKWRTHAERWRELGATHLAIATHNAGPTDVDGHLARI